MGAPLNHLQVLSGHNPIRFIGTDLLKNYFFEIGVPPFNIDFDVKVKKIDYDQEYLKAHLRSGSFTPAVRDSWDLKSLTSGNQRGELMEYPPLVARITGMPRAALRGVPPLNLDISGNLQGVVRESGYIQFSKWHGNLAPFWLTTGVVSQSFSGTLSPFDSDSESVNYVFMTGTVYPESVPHVPTRRDDATGDGAVGISYSFFQGVFQGGA